MKKHYSSLISSAFGKFASKEFSPTMQKIINSSYVKLMGLDMSEFREPSTYKTLNKLFTRALEKPRDITDDKTKLLCGVDSLVTDAGTIIDGRAYQIKGMSYSIEELFGEKHKEAVEVVEGGEFINFYLSPKDYHRYHTPMDLEVISLTHIPGKLYPVNMPLLNNKKDLFIENERVIMECKDNKGRTQVLVLVGALNVGKMVVSFENSIETNSDIRESQHYKYDGLKLGRAELFGWFEMGSTVLTFSQKGSIVPNVSLNQKVSFGEVIGDIN